MSLGLGTLCIRNIETLKPGVTKLPFTPCNVPLDRHAHDVISVGEFIGGDCELWQPARRFLCFLEYVLEHDKCVEAWEIRTQRRQSFGGQGPT